MSYLHLDRDQLYLVNLRTGRDIKKKGKPVLFIHESRHMSVCPLSTFEQVDASETQQHLRIDPVRAHEGPGIRQGMREPLEQRPGEGRVRVRSIGITREVEEVVVWRAESEEQGYHAEDAAWREWGGLRLLLLLLLLSAAAGRWTRWGSRWQ